MTTTTTARRLRYQVAVSLDGFITGPDGGIDWITMDPAIDFGALFAEFDTAVMGRKTYEAAAGMGGGAMPGIDVVVFSRSLPASSRKGVRIVGDDPREAVRQLKSKPGRDIWLFGGGELFRTLLDAGLVDTVELAVMPVLVGSGTPVLPPGEAAALILTDQRTLAKSGIVMLAYSVRGSAAPPPRISYIKSGKDPARKKTTKGKAGAKKGTNAGAKRSAGRTSPSRGRKV